MITNTPESKKLDYKKEFPEFYSPKPQPSIITIPQMNFIAVQGRGDPNDENGEYKQSIALLYGIAFTIKMSKKGTHKIKGYFDFVVPPLEGLWWQDGSDTLDYTRKNDMNFISMIRLPDFATKTEVNWAITEAAKKKQGDFSKVKFYTYDEGLCVQSLHIGSYDDEPQTIESMHKLMSDNGYISDIQNPRYHHEIYLSDPRRCEPSKLRTIIRHPIKRSTQ